MHLQFIGDKDGHGPEQIKLYGYTFAKFGAPVEVTDVFAQTKLQHNSHFATIEVLDGSLDQIGPGKEDASTPRSARSRRRS